MRRGWMGLACACLFVWVGSAAGVAAAEPESNEATGPVDALIHGTPVLNVRGRIELAKADGLERSEAYTVRTRLGYGTKPWFGTRVYVDMENIAAATTSTYFDPTDPPNSKGQTPITDPPGTELNQGFLEIDRPDWLGSKLTGGRQSMVYDDARFIGNVAWRQNMQTFDAVAFQTTAGLEAFEAKYAWLGRVNRIFGGGGDNPALADFESNSQLVHLGWDAIPRTKVVAFAYLLDLELDQLPNPYANSNMSFGFRANGDFAPGEKLTLDWLASYAWQADYADNPTDYSAHYVDAELGLRFAPLGRVAAGFEMLGSDDGNQQFLTPLATAHKFNGWADVYLNNGGPTGLRDLRVMLQPKLPWKLGMLVAYHRFWDDESGTLRGNEIDASLKRDFTKYLTVLAKGAYFDSATTAFPEPDTWRFWLDVVVQF